MLGLDKIRTRYATGLVLGAVLTAAVVVGVPMAASRTSDGKITKNTALPVVSGSAAKDQILSTTNGTWTYNPTSYTYQWSRCNSGGTNCTTISGATSSWYRLTALDVGAKIRSTVTATNSYGRTAANSAVYPASGTVADDSPPENSSAPSVMGTTTQDETLTANEGSWTNDPYGYDYQWQRCNAAGSDCASISGATGSSYDLTWDDAGSTIRVVVDAYNDSGTSHMFGVSDTSAVVEGLAPENTSRPTISGTTTQGQTLSAVPGTWTNDPTGYTYQWQRCDSSDSNCSDISGATDSSYLLVWADAGSRLQVSVHASNDYATSREVITNPTAVVLGLAPANDVLPSISGWTDEGRTLTADPGTWSNGPGVFNYHWLRCDSAGDNCVAIPGASEPSYSVVDDDIGQTIRVAVDTSNDYGSSDSATSDATNVIAGTAPVNTSPPTIAGTTVQGSTLAANRGSWTGSPGSYSYQWQRCGSSGASCVDIAGASNDTYILSASDVGHTLVIVVGTGNGSTPAASNRFPASGTIASKPAVPKNSSIPAISGNALKGNKLTTSTGTWTGSPVSFKYQWRRCDSIGGHCSNIAGALAKTRVVSALDVGYSLRVTVTAANSAGSAGAVSDPRSVPSTSGGAPVSVSPPTISGRAIKGRTLTLASYGTWINSPVSYWYQWRRCNASGLNCQDVGGATAKTYTIGRSDLGSTFRLALTAWNTYGSSVSAFSSASAVARAS
jgi:hypothetical protein